MGQQKKAVDVCMVGVVSVLLVEMSWLDHFNLQLLATVPEVKCHHALPRKEIKTKKEYLGLQGMEGKHKISYAYTFIKFYLETSKTGYTFVYL